MSSTKKPTLDPYTFHLKLLVHPCLRI